MISHTKKADLKRTNNIFIVVKKRKQENEEIFCKYNKCSRVFSDKSAYLYHKKFEHPNKRYYRCYIKGCDQSYRQPSSLKKHLQLHFSFIEGFKCCYCPVSFSKYTTLLVHLHSHDENGNLQKKRFFSTEREATKVESDKSQTVPNSDLSTIEYQNSISLEQVKSSESQVCFDIYTLLESNNLYYDVDFTTSELNNFVRYVSSMLPHQSQNFIPA